MPLYTITIADRCLESTPEEMTGSIMSYDANKGDPPGPERRQRPDVREIFDHAVTLVAPYYRAAIDVPMEHWAARALREAHPELDAQGFQILMAAVSRECIKMRAREVATATADRTRTHVPQRAL